MVIILLIDLLVGGTIGISTIRPLHVCSRLSLPLNFLGRLLHIIPVPVLAL